MTSVESGVEKVNARERSKLQSDAKNCLIEMCIKVFKTVFIIIYLLQI